MIRKLIYVFHNWHSRGEITLDCRLRIEAAKQVALKNPDAIVFFVGGCGISGASDMEKFWQENEPKLPNKLCLLDKANNTADAVSDIIENASSYEGEKELILISNAYHAKRIEFFAKLNDLNAIIFTAEDILEKTDKFNSKVRIYKSSLIYKLKIIADQIVLAYAYIFDHRQQMVKLWRKFIRKWK